MFRVLETAYGLRWHRLIRTKMLVVFGCIVLFAGCSGRPPSELTDEQLKKQIAEDAQSVADEDRLERELKQKARKRQ